MTLLTSRVLSTVSNNGFKTPAAPTSASTAVPPRAGLGTVATGWHPARTSTAASAAVDSRLREMRFHPDEGHRADQEGGDQHPRGPVDLTLQAAARAIPAAAPVAAASDRPPQARRFGRLGQHARHQEQREYGLCEDERRLDLSHGTGRFYLAF